MITSNSMIKLTCKAEPAPMGGGGLGGWVKNNKCHIKFKKCKFIIALITLYRVDDQNTPVA